MEIRNRGPGYTPPRVVAGILVVAALIPRRLSQKWNWCWGIFTSPVEKEKFGKYKPLRIRISNTVATWSYWFPRELFPRILAFKMCAAMTLKNSRGLLFVHRRARYSWEGRLMTIWRGAREVRWSTNCEIGKSLRRLLEVVGGWLEGIPRLTSCRPWIIIGR